MYWSSSSWTWPDLAWSRGCRPARAPTRGTASACRWWRWGTWCSTPTWPSQPLTRVSIPQHEPSEAWGGTGSWHHNGSGFTIATVGPGPLLLLMLPLPYTRQLSHRGSGTGSVTPEWKEWITLLVSRSRCRSYFPVNQLIGLQYSVLLAAAPALPSHSRD